MLTKIARGYRIGDLHDHSIQELLQLLFNSSKFGTKDIRIIKIEQMDNAFDLVKTHTKRRHVDNKVLYFVGTSFYYGELVFVASYDFTFYLVTVSVNKLHPNDQEKLA